MTGGDRYGSEMNGGATKTADDAASKAQQAASKAQETAGKVTDKVSEKASDMGDAGIVKAAEGLGQASDQIREKAQAQGGVQGQVGTKVADGLDKTSEYLESHDTSQIMDDVETYVKAHPMTAVAGAVVGGFLLARILR